MVNVSTSFLQTGDKTMLKFVKNFIRDESGASAIEYALMAALIAVVIIGGAQLVGSRASTTFSRVSSGLNAAN
jgi:pilus assembly protein Flp/PilA